MRLSNEKMSLGEIIAKLQQYEKQDEDPSPISKGPDLIPRSKYSDYKKEVTSSYKPQSSKSKPFLTKESANSMIKSLQTIEKDIECKKKVLLMIQESTCRNIYDKTFENQPYFQCVIQFYNAVIDKIEEYAIRNKINKGKGLNVISKHKHFWPLARDVIIDVIDKQLQESKLIEEKLNAEVVSDSAELRPQFDIDQLKKEKVFLQNEVRQIGEKGRKLLEDNGRMFQQSHAIKNELLTLTNHLRKMKAENMEINNFIKSSDAMRAEGGVQIRLNERKMIQLNDQLKQIAAEIQKKKEESTNLSFEIERLKRERTWVGRYGKQKMVVEVEKIVPYIQKETIIKEVIQQKIVVAQKVVEKIVEVPIVHQKIVEKIVEVPKIMEIEKIVEKVVRVIEYRNANGSIQAESNIVEVQRIVEKIVVVPRVIQKIIEVPQIIEKVVIKTIKEDSIKQIQKIVHIPQIKQKIIELQVPRNIYIEVEKKVDYTGSEQVPKEQMMLKQEQRIKNAIQNMKKEEAELNEKVKELNEKVKELKRSLHQNEIDWKQMEKKIQDKKKELDLYLKKSQEQIKKTSQENKFGEKNRLKTPPKYTQEFHEALIKSKELKGENAILVELNKKNEELKKLIERDLPNAQSSLNYALKEIEVKNKQLGELGIKIRQAALEEKTLLDSIKKEKDNLKEVKNIIEENEVYCNEIEGKINKKKEELDLLLKKESDEEIKRKQLEASLLNQGNNKRIKELEREIFELRRKVGDNNRPVNPHKQQNKADYIRVKQLERENTELRSKVIDVDRYRNLAIKYKQQNEQLKKGQFSNSLSQRTSSNQSKQNETRVLNLQRELSTTKQQLNKYIQQCRILAEQAKKHQNMVDIEKQVEIREKKWEVEEQNSAQERQTEQYKKMKKEKEELAEKLRVLRTDIEENEQYCQEIEDKIDRKKEELNSLLKKKSQFEGKQGLSKQQNPELAATQQEIEAMKITKSELQKKLSSMQELVVKQEEEVKKIKKEKAELCLRNRQLEKDIQANSQYCQKIEKDIEKKQEELTKMNKIEEKKRELQALLQQLEK